MDFALTDDMKEELQCPRCGAGNKAGARFCSQCGLTYTHCPRCNALNPDAVEFCTKCGEGISPGKIPAGHEDDVGEKPYVIWEGLPFAWLERRTQTKRQFFLSLWIYIAFVSMLTAVFMFAAVPAALQGESGAGAGICLSAIFLVLVCGLIYIYWLFGRRGAEEEQKSR